MNSLPPSTLPTTTTFVPAQLTLVPQTIPEPIVPQQIIQSPPITPAPLQNQPHTMDDPNNSKLYYLTHQSAIDVLNMNKKEEYINVNVEKHI